VKFKISEQRLSDINKKYPEWDMRNLFVQKSSIEKNLSDKRLIKIYKDIEMSYSLSSKQIVMMLSPETQL